MKDTAGIILAAGKGTRMKSQTPKVLHRLLEKPLIHYPIELLENLKIKRNYLVITPEQTQIPEFLQDRVGYLYQQVPRGTGDALLCAVSSLEQTDLKHLVVLSGDMPLLKAASLKKLLACHQKEKNVVTFLTAHVPEPGQLGRVIRDKENKVARIAEAKQGASPEVLAVKEVNLGTYCFSLPFLKKYLPKVPVNKKAGEIYLTDLVEMAVKRGEKVNAVICPDCREGMGVNSRRELAEAARVLKEELAEDLMLNGVTMPDPSSVFISPQAKIGEDVTILPFTIIEGATVIGRGCTIGPSSRIVDSRIGKDCEIQFSVVKEAQIADRCGVGPFAYLRPGTVMKNQTRVGSFVEVKKTVIEPGAKIPHLSYIGDADIGKDVNIGAGTITCNYDGVNKNPTVIGEGAFIGSNTNLIAPVKIGKGAKTGAGAVVTRDVPPYTLAAGVPAVLKKKLK